MAAQPRTSTVVKPNHPIAPANTGMRLWSSPTEQGLVGTVAAVRKSLEEGKAPDCKLIAANHATALELKTLVQAHALENTVKLGVALLYGDVPSDVGRHWVHLHKKGTGP